MPLSSPNVTSAKTWFRGTSIALAASAVYVTTLLAVAVAAPMTMHAGSAGMTGGFYDGARVTEVYTKNFYCDKSVPSQASSGCEQGQRANVPPPGHYDPEYAIVPIGFTPATAMAMNCRPGVPCVAHPATIDMTRVANALALIMKTTGPALLPTLGNKTTPPHDHYLTTTHDGQAEWWNVVIIGCTSPATFESIRAHKSFAYIQRLLAAGEPTLLKPTPTNVFLFFAVTSH